MPKSGINKKRNKQELYYPKRNYANAIRVLKILSKDKLLSTEQLRKKLGKRDDYPHKRARILLETLMEFDYCRDYGSVTSNDQFCTNCEKSKKFLVSMDGLRGALSTLEQNAKERDIAKKEGGYKPKNWFHCEKGYVLGRLVWLNCINCDQHVEINTDRNDWPQYKIQQDRYWSLTNNGKLVMFSLLKRNTLYNFIKRNTDQKIIELANVLLLSQKKDWVERLIKSIKNTMNFRPNVIDVVKSWYDEMKLKVFYLDIDSEQFPILDDYKKREYYSMQFRHADVLNKSVKEQDW